MLNDKQREAALRLVLGATQKDVAEYLDIHINTVGKWLREQDFIDEKNRIRDLMVAKAVDKWENVIDNVCKNAVELSQELIDIGLHGDKESVRAKAIVDALRLIQTQVNVKDEEIHEVPIIRMTMEDKPDKKEKSKLKLIGNNVKAVSG